MMKILLLVLNERVGFFMIEKLKDKIKSYYKDADLALVEKAYHLACIAHKGKSLGEVILYPVSVPIC